MRWLFFLFLVSGCGADRGDAMLAALALAFDVGAALGVDVVGGQVDEFADPQAGVDGQGEHHLVSSAGPGRDIGCCEQRLSLLRVEVADQGFRGLGGWDGQDAADGFGGLGVVGQGVCEEDADRAEAGVAGGGRVGPLAGEVVGSPVTALVSNGYNRSRVILTDFSWIGRARLRQPGATSFR